MRRECVSNQLLENQSVRLAATDRQLADLLAQLDQISSALAHDLRGPLQSVSGYAYLLATGKAGPLSDEQGQFVRHIQTGAQGILKAIANYQERLGALGRSGTQPR